MIIKTVFKGQTSGQILIFGMFKKILSSMSSSISEDESRSRIAGHTYLYSFTQDPLKESTNDVYIQNKFFSTIQGGWLIEIDSESHLVYCVLTQNRFIVRNHPKSESTLLDLVLDSNTRIRMVENLIVQIKSGKIKKRYQFNDSMDQVRWSYSLMINGLNIRFQTKFKPSLKSELSSNCNSFNKDTDLYEKTISLLNYCFRELYREDDFPFYEFSDIIDVEEYIVACYNPDLLNVFKEDNITSAKSQMSQTDSMRNNKSKDYSCASDKNMEMVEKILNVFGENKETDLLQKKFHISQVAGTFLSIVLTNTKKISFDNKNISELSTLHDYLSNWLNIAVDPVYFKKRYLRLKNIFAESLFESSHDKTSQIYFQQWLSPNVSLLKAYISISVNCLNLLFEENKYFPFNEFSFHKDVHFFKMAVDSIIDKDYNYCNIGDFIDKLKIPDREEIARRVATFLYNVILNTSVFEEKVYDFKEIDDFLKYLKRVISHFRDEKKDMKAIYSKIDHLFSNILVKDNKLSEFLDNNNIPETKNTANLPIKSEQNLTKGYRPIKRWNMSSIQRLKNQKQPQVPSPKKNENVISEITENHEKSQSGNENMFTPTPQLIEYSDVKGLGSSQSYANSSDDNSTIINNDDYDEPSEQEK